MLSLSEHGKFVSCFSDPLLCKFSPTFQASKMDFFLRILSKKKCWLYKGLEKKLKGGKSNITIDHKKMDIYLKY